MPQRCGDVGKNNIKNIEDEINHASQNPAKFMLDIRFNVAAKTIQYKHVDQQVGPIGMYKT